MNQEERTREEILKCMVANTQASLVMTAMVSEIYTLLKAGVMPATAEPGKLLPDRAQAAPLGPVLSNPAEMNPEPVVTSPMTQKAQRKAKAPAAPQAPVEPPQAPVVATPDIPISKAPVKPHKTAADLREALQACLAKHGMNGTKERLTPFAKLSDVPDAEIDATIARLLAE